MMKSTPLAIAAAVALLPLVAFGAPPPEDKCESAKNQAAGEYARCRQAAEAKRVLSGDTEKYDRAIARCEAAVAAQFAKAEAAAAKKGTACPTNGDAADFEAWIAAHADLVAESLAPGGALPECGNGEIDLPSEECDQADLRGRSCEGLGYESGALACTDSCELDLSDCANPCRFDGGRPAADGQCWFVGKQAMTQSCDAICAAAGRTCDETTTASISLSGSWPQCGVIADLFLQTAGPTGAFEAPECGASAAVGCVLVHLGGPGPTAIPVTSPTPTCAADAAGSPCEEFSIPGRRVCACD